MTTSTPQDDRLANMRATEAAIDAEMEQLRTRLSALAKEKRELRDAACPVAVGDVVIATVARVCKAGDEMLVRSLEHRSWDKLGGLPWVKASPRRADGTWGTKVVHLFEGYKLKI